MEGQKQFLILGTMNCAGYKEVFPLIQSNQIWLGVSSNKTLQLQLPDDAEKYKVMIGDKKYADVPACTWFTNIDNIVRHTEIPYLTMEQHTILGNSFEHYANYEAIEVPRCTLIPIDYSGVMGVPLSFLTQYNPNEFEIVGLGKDDLGRSIGVGADISDEEWETLRVESGGILRRGTLFIKNDDGSYAVPFARVLIRRRFE